MMGKHSIRLPLLSQVKSMYSTVRHKNTCSGFKKMKRPLSYDVNLETHTAWLSVWSSVWTTWGWGVVPGWLMTRCHQHDAWDASFRWPLLLSSLHGRPSCFGAAEITVWIGACCSWWIGSGRLGAWFATVQPWPFYKSQSVTPSTSATLRLRPLWRSHLWAAGNRGDLCRDHLVCRGAKGALSVRVLLGLTGGVTARAFKLHISPRCFRINTHESTHSGAAYLLKITKVNKSRDDHTVTFIPLSTFALYTVYTVCSFIYEYTPFSEHKVPQLIHLNTLIAEGRDWHWVSWFNLATIYFVDRLAIERQMRGWSCVAQICSVVLFTGAVYIQ